MRFVTPRSPGVIETVGRLSLLLAWFCLDMITPDIPGAFMFDPDQPVEVLRSQRVIVPVAIAETCALPDLRGSRAT